jgi:NADH-quinone oxidoreductase subunit J
VAEIIYSLFFAVTVLAALMVVFSRHAVYSALYLVAVMVSIAAIFIMINAQLPAVLQMLVYAGAIMVVFVFVIMLLNLGKMGELPLATRGVRRVGAFLFLAFLAQSIVLVVKFGGAVQFTEAETEPLGLGQVAMTLLTRYLYAFEMTSVMLLVAVIGAMALARRRLFSGPRQAQTGEQS